jgi:ABC-2 type transport system ATP-binding protein
MSLSEARSRAHDTLDQLELLEFRNKPADILSGGLKQRIRVAMAIATDAELIFLDEPTLGLDAVARRKLWDVLKGISKDGRTILLTTHYMEEAEILSDHVAVVHQGGVVREGHPRDLLAAIKENAKVDMVGDAFSDQELVTYGRLVKIAERRRVFTSREHASELAAEVLKRKGHATVAPVSLEDVFVELVQDGEEES